MRVVKYGIRLVKESEVEYPTTELRSPHDIYDVMRNQYDGLDREVFSVVYLNMKNMIIGTETISVGSLSQTVIHPREVFKGAILANAACIILVHNHPSGDTEPSKDDIATTKRLVKSGKLLNIPVLDHIILGSYYKSFKELGLIKE